MRKTVDGGVSYTHLVKIKPEACDPDDAERLEDLILAAINDACAKATEAENELIPANVRGML